MIKIQNIYYMLAYAFQVLNEEGYKQVAAEDFEYAFDLLAAILSKGIANQIKRGLNRDYIGKTEAGVMFFARYNQKHCKQQHIGIKWTSPHSVGFCGILWDYD